MTDMTHSVSETAQRWADDHHDQLVAVRRDLHAHPELSGAEHRTTDVVARILGDAGYEIRRLTSGSGLIADAPADSGGNVTGGERIAIRADLDALAMHDRKEVDYRSTVDGVAHACGHDVHTTIALGTALFFAEHPELATGPLRFIFQPAEERVPGGALDVLADDGLADVDAVIGLHCEPKLDCGTIGLRAGAITSAADMISITIIGPGGHTARPELTVDTIALAARIVTQVPGLVADELARIDPDACDVKLVFGAIHGGDAPNVIPTRCELRASVRTKSLVAWERLESVARDAVAAVVEGTGATCEVDYTHGVPPTVNDASVVERLRRAAAWVDGTTVVEAVQSWGGDDFAWFTREVPGAYVRLGVHDARSDAPYLDLHAGLFDVDEHSISIGTLLMIAAVTTR